MRPLRPNNELAQRAWLLERRDAVEARLLDTYGSWCSICERAILDDAWAWDITARATLPRSAEALEQCADLLVLCRNCQDAQALTIESPWQESAVPVADPTFSLGDQLFRHAPVETEVLIVDEAGPATETQRVPLVWVLSDDPPGQATIARSALTPTAGTAGLALIQRFATSACGCARARGRPPHVPPIRSTARSSLGPCRRCTSSGTRGSSRCGRRFSARGVAPTGSSRG